MGDTDTTPCQVDSVNNEAGTRHEWLPSIFEPDRMPPIKDTSDLSNEQGVRLGIGVVDVVVVFRARE